MTVCRNEGKRNSFRNEVKMSSWVVVVAKTWSQTTKDREEAFFLRELFLFGKKSRGEKKEILQ